MGESTNPLKVQFDRRVRLEFRGATITSDAGLLAAREMDEDDSLKPRRAIRSYEA